jgi:glycosyltransferase involved in cell wall biosynthesis
MRIAQISTVATPVSGEKSGSVEGIVWSLTRELVKLGHEVTVFAVENSESNGEVVFTLSGAYGINGSPGDWQMCEWINLCKAIEQSKRFDLLHSHSYLNALPLQQLSHSPVVNTLHILGDGFADLWKMYPDACITAISKFQWTAFPELKPAAVIHHGVDPEKFSFNSKPDDYVCYLGRFIPDKGPLEAIKTAEHLGLPLVMAGPPNHYFKDYIAPLVDGESVKYIGFVSGAAKTKLLSGAKALLYPVKYPEPFGMVMIEAMMCGTPVAAIDLGAVSEIIDEGITGSLAKTAEEFPETVLKTLMINRDGVRNRAESRFSARRMALDYLQVYQQLLVS